MADPQNALSTPYALQQQLKIELTPVCIAKVEQKLIPALDELEAQEKRRDGGRERRDPEGMT